MHAPAFLDAVTDRVRACTGRDLAAYRSATIGRRVALHMARLRCLEPEAYVDRLARDPDEVLRLLALVSIKVSRFFRVRRAFDVLERRVIPVLAAASGGAPLRAWVAGCAEGEEAYSLAWLFEDAAPPVPPGSTVLATDVDPAALAAAARAEYAATAFVELDAARRPRLEPRGARLAPPRAVCARVAFRRHDLLDGSAPEEGGAAFDLVLCRNVLIYVARPHVAPAQRRLAAAVRPGGVLVLGESEALAPGLEPLFAPVDRLARVFARTAVPVSAEGAA